jgi:hypothetical protein
MIPGVLTNGRIIFVIPLKYSFDPLVSGKNIYLSELICQAKRLNLNTTN